MIRYLAYLIAYLAMLCVAIVVTPFLPAFATIRVGGINNDDHQGAGLRLPLWLSWFDTKDNALTGDEAFERSHPQSTYWDMVLWLYRNPLYGFKWDVLGYPIKQPALIVKHTETAFTYFDAFQCQLSGKKFGWILDAYYQRNNPEPKAIFVFWM